MSQYSEGSHFRCQMKWIKTQKQELRYSVKKKQGYAREEVLCVAAFSKSARPQECSLGSWRGRQEPWGEFLSRVNLGGIGHCVGCLGYCRMFSIPDTKEQHASSIPQTLRHPEMLHTGSWWHSWWNTTAEICMSHWRTWTSFCEDWRSWKALNREGSRSDLYFSWIPLNHVKVDLRE